MRNRFDTPEAEQLRELAPTDQRRTGSSVRPKVDTSRGRVLVVDDSEETRHMLSAVLQLEGFDVLVAQDGEEGFAFFRALHRAIDAVVLDMQMPGMDGADTFRRLKSVDPSVRVILCSGGAAGPRVDQAIRDGALEFVQKPFSREEILDSLDRAIGADGDKEDGSANCNAKSPSSK